MSKTAIVVGAGHNGLVAAVMLAKRGVKVRVLEDKPVIGGAVRTERPFKKAPGLATSTGAYLLGLMPPEIIDVRRRTTSSVATHLVPKFLNAAIICHGWNGRIF